jgi:hypothetical protein
MNGHWRGSIAFRVERLGLVMVRYECEICDINSVIHSCLVGSRCEREYRAFRTCRRCMDPGIPHQVPDSQHVSLAGGGTCVVTSAEAKLYGIHCDGHILCPHIRESGHDIVVCTSRTKAASSPASIPRLACIWRH